MPKLIPDPQVADDFGVCLKTLGRWDQTPELGFPPPIYVRKRKYRDEGALEDFKLQKAREAAAEAKAAAARMHSIAKPAPKDSKHRKPRTCVKSGKEHLATKQ
jgi:hypothetical protein